MYPQKQIAQPSGQVSRLWRDERGERLDLIFSLGKSRSVSFDGYWRARCFEKILDSNKSDYYHHHRFFSIDDFFSANGFSHSR